MKSGWYFYACGKEYFIESVQQNKTRKFIEKILNAAKFPINEGNIDYLMRSLLKANLEIKHCPSCPDLGIDEHDYYNIFGEDFGGYGSDDVNDGRTVILSII